MSINQDFALLWELFEQSQEVIETYTIKSMKRADRRNRSLNKFNQRLKKTEWPIVELVYDEEQDKEIEVPHRGNISALKNNPHTCRTCCNQKWKKRNYGTKESRIVYLKQNDHLNDIEQDHFNGSWNDVDEFVWIWEYWLETNNHEHNCLGDDPNDDWYDYDDYDWSHGISNDDAEELPDSMTLHQLTDDLGWDD